MAKHFLHPEDRQIVETNLWSSTGRGCSWNEFEVNSQIGIQKYWTSRELVVIVEN